MRDDDDIWFDSLAGGRGDEPEKAAAAARAKRLVLWLDGALRYVPFAALPAMADELCDVVRGLITGLTKRGSACTAISVGNGALPGLGFADAAFTEARFKSVLQDTGDYSVLHIGTHFSLRSGSVMRSFLVLGDGSRLSLDAISKMSFSGIDLVTLSACPTALGGL